MVTHHTMAKMPSLWHSVASQCAPQQAYSGKVLHLFITKLIIINTLCGNQPRHDGWNVMVENHFDNTNCRSERCIKTGMCGGTLRCTGMWYGLDMANPKQCLFHWNYSIGKLYFDIVILNIVAFYAKWCCNRVVGRLPLLGASSSKPFWDLTWGLL